MPNKKPVIFILLYTLILTFPIIFFMFFRIPGKYADTYQVWGKALEFRNLIADEGVVKTIEWQLHNLRITPIEAIGWAQKITSPFMGYNLVWLFSFFMAAWGMYCLANYLIKSRLAAVVSAIIFSFSPFHFFQGISTNIGTMHYEWIPFFVLYLIKFLRSTKLKDFILTILFLLLIALAEHQLLAFTLIFAVILAVAFFIKNHRVLYRFKFWIYGAGGIVILLLAIKFIFGGLLTVTQSEENYLDPGSDQVKRYSADAIDFFVPASINPFWGEKLNYLRKDTEANGMGRQSNYVGYTVIFLALLSLLSLFGAQKRVAIKLFFLFVGVFFAILSLGPYLHWKGEIIEGFWMPYTFLYEHVPFWYIIRTVNRLYVISLLGFALSAGFGLNYILSFLNNKKKEGADNTNGIDAEDEKETQSKRRGNVFKKEEAVLSPRQIRIEQNKITGTKFSKFLKNKSLVITAIFIGLISVEYLSIPVPTFTLNYSRFYDDLAIEEGDFSIIDIPGATSYDYGSKLMFYNQIHQKNNLACMDFARVIKDKWDFQKNTPIINDLLYSLPTGGKPPNKEIVNDYYYNLATKILNFYNIKYIVVSKAYLRDSKKFDGEAYENTLNFIDGQLDEELVYEDNLLVAFKINPSKHLDGWFLALELTGDYWAKKEGEKDSVARWAKSGASLKLVNMGDSPQNIRLSFDTRIRDLRIVEVYLNGIKEDSFKIKKKKEEHTVLFEEVIPGDNQITFKILDLAGNYVDSHELKRGVKFSNLKTINWDR